GRFKEAAQFFSQWLDPPQTPPRKTPQRTARKPVLVSSELEERRQLAQSLATRCFPRTGLGPEAWNCLESQGLVTGPQPHHLWKALPPGDPFFAALNEVDLEPWTNPKAAPFWRAWTDFAEEWELPLEQILQWLSQGSDLSRRAHQPLWEAL